MSARNRRHYRTLVTLLGLTLLATGCGDEDTPDKPGVLSVSWKVSPLGCAESGVRNIDVSIAGKGAPSDRLYVACEAGSTTIEELMPGRYEINLFGVDDNGKAIFESGLQTFGMRSGEVTTVPELKLTAKKASLAVNWFFDNGRLCNANGVKTMALGVYDTDGFVISETTHPCDNGVGGIDGLSSGRLVVEVVGMAADGRGLFRGLTEVEVERGDELNVEVPLVGCVEGC